MVGVSVGVCEKLVAFYDFEPVIQIIILPTGPSKYLFFFTIFKENITSRRNKIRSLCTKFLFLHFPSAMFNLNRDHLGSTTNILTGTQVEYYHYYLNDPPKIIIFDKFFAHTTTP